MHKKIGLSILLALMSQIVLTQSAFAEGAPMKAKSLLDIYQNAVTNDPTLASATSANQAAQEIIEQGKALYRPTVNFNAGVSASQTNIKFIGTGNPFRTQGRQNFEGYTYGVDASQPIFRKQNLVQMEQKQETASGTFRT